MELRSCCEFSPAKNVSAWPQRSNRFSGDINMMLRKNIHIISEQTFYICAVINFQNP